jgi:hypothetical protein
VDRTKIEEDSGDIIVAGILRSSADRKAFFEAFDRSFDQTLLVVNDAHGIQGGRYIKMTASKVFCP